MDNVIFWQANGVELVTVKESENLFRTMTKEYYDAQLAAQSTPNEL
jgi:hypothetical protein